MLVCNNITVLIDTWGLPYLVFQKKSWMVESSLFNYNIVFNSHSLFLKIKSGAMLFNLIYPMVSSWKQLSLLVYILMNLSLM